MLNNSKLGLWLALLLAGGVWFYTQQILIPYQVVDSAAHNRPRGVLSDLYPRWLGARELLLHHRDPYGAEVTRDIQAGYYGRSLDASRPGDPLDEQRFAYPVYVVFLLAPTVWAPFWMVRIAFTWALMIVTGISVLLWLRVLRWRPSGMGLAIIVVLVFGSFATVQGIKLQQLTLLVAGLIAGSAVLLAGGELFLAGVLLALAAIKPQLVVLPAAWLMLWTLSAWKERQRFFWGFMGTALLLSVGGEYLLPGWVGRFAGGVVAYERYTGGGSLLDHLATRPGGRVLTLVFVAATAAVCWRRRRAAANSEEFNLTLAWVLTVTVVVVPMVAPYNQLLLLPGVFLIVRAWKSLWQRSLSSRMVCSIAALAVFWPGITSLALLSASMFLPPASVQRAWAVPLWTNLVIPLVVLGLLAICIRDSRALRN